MYYTFLRIYLLSLSFSLLLLLLLLLLILLLLLLLLLLLYLGFYLFKTNRSMHCILFTEIHEA